MKAVAPDIQPILTAERGNRTSNPTITALAGQNVARNPTGRVHIPNRHASNTATNIIAAERRARLTGVKLRWLLTRGSLDMLRTSTRSHFTRKLLN
jgi:hypothetical protein